MRMLRRKSGEDACQDEHLTFLTTRQAGLLRMLVRQMFAEQGREVTAYADHVRDDSGARFGLWNVAVACFDEPRGERAWPRVVAEHVRRVLADIDRDVFAGLRPAQVRARTYARLMAAAAVPDLTWFRYARPVAPGLLELLAFDLPDSIVTFRDQDAERFGGAAALRQAGLTSLRALPVEHHERMTAPDGGHFDVLLGESVYTASRLLVMPDLLAGLLGRVNLRHGVLVAAPNRHQAAVHVIRDQSVIASINLMAGYALEAFRSAAGSLSPNVFWWRDGRWEQISRLEPDGGISVLVGAELGRTLEQLPQRRR